MSTNEVLDESLHGTSGSVCCGGLERRKTSRRKTQDKMKRKSCRLSVEAIQRSGKRKNGAQAFLPVSFSYWKSRFSNRQGAKDAKEELFLLEEKIFNRKKREATRRR